MSACLLFIYMSNECVLFVVSFGLVVYNDSVPIKCCVFFKDFFAVHSIFSGLSRLSHGASV